MSAVALPASDPAELARSLPAPAATLLVVDFDGTLSPIVDHPDAAAPEAGAVAALAALAAVTTVAVISGRPVDDVRERLEDLPLVFAGGHGAEIVLPDGRRDSLVRPEEVTSVLDDAQSLVRDVLGDSPGWLVEPKATSLAVHHRLAPVDSVESLLPRVAAILERCAEQPPGFHVLAGKAVVELRPDGVDKGAALSRIAALWPTSRPLAIGDDVTDEDAFQAATRLGGQAILVSTDARPTAATHRLTDPAAVVAFLTAYGQRG